MEKKDVLLKMLGLEVGEEITKEEAFQVFTNLKMAKKVLEEHEKKTLKPLLFTSAEKLGYQTESGGYRAVLPDGSGWEKQARVSVTVDQEKALDTFNTPELSGYIDLNEYIDPERMEEALELLRGISPDLVLEEKTVTNESVEQAFLSGALSDEALGDIVSRKVTYALVEVKKKKK